MDYEKKKLHQRKNHEIKMVVCKVSVSGNRERYSYQK